MTDKTQYDIASLFSSVNALNGRIANTQGMVYTMGQTINELAAKLGVNSGLEGVDFDKQIAEIEAELVIVNEYFDKLEKVQEYTKQTGLDHRTAMEKN